LSEITLCLITKNEELNIEKCLASFSCITNQALVVDTGSKDKTVEIAHKMGAKVLEFIWCDDFSKARNFALENVETTWTMMVDADQFLDFSDKEILQKDFAKAVNTSDVIFLKSVFCGSSAYLPKIWRTNLELKYKYPVHEVLDLNSKQSTKYVSNAKILHKKQSDFRESRLKYVQIMENFCTEKGLDKHILYYLVSDYLYLCEYKKCLEWAATYLETFAEQNRDTSQVIFYGAKALAAIGKKPEAIDNLYTAIEIHENNLSARLFLAELLTANDDYEKAKEQYKWIIEAQTNEFNSFYTDESAKSVALEKIKSITSEQ
jgi:glycosyltransferase involved in cell wall biosynthesis